MHSRKLPRWSVAQRYRALRARYADLQARHAEETAKAMPNSEALQRLSRRVRRIKEELTTIECLLKAIGARIEDVLSRASVPPRARPDQVSAQPA